MYTADPATPQTALPIVSSYNEWDPLEEVIVGVMTGASVPSLEGPVTATMPTRHLEFFREQAGRGFDGDAIKAAEENLERFVQLLEGHGVVVRRPERLDFARPFATPDWASPGGLYAAMPRDLLLVVGDDIIECPLAWRSRHFEVNAFRPLLKHYFQAGARWTSAPRPVLDDASHDADFDPEVHHAPDRYAVTEHEPLFDAADFARCGRDLFVQLSHVTNRFGVEWLRRHLGPDYAIHVLDVTDEHPMHIDATFVPLAPGKVLVNPLRMPQLPPMFRDWEMLVAPAPSRQDDDFYMSSAWISMNTFMLNPTTVFVEQEETVLHRAFERWGFDVVPCPFRGFNRFGGAFHCATLDIRRRGGLESYF